MNAASLTRFVRGLTKLVESKVGGSMTDGGTDGGVWRESGGRGRSDLFLHEIHMHTEMQQQR